MLHPTDYELAVNYFLEKFAGDATFIRASEPEQMPHLVSVLGIVVSKAVGRRVEVENALVSYLREHRFVHGNARADGRIVFFFYFEDADRSAHVDPGNSRPDGSRSFSPQGRTARSAMELRHEACRAEFGNPVLHTSRLL